MKLLKVYNAEKTKAPVECPLMALKMLENSYTKNEEQLKIMLPLAWLK